MRAKKVAINSIWGMLLRFLTIVLGFAGRTVFIKCLSADYLGISGLFTNVLSILSLSELGFSSAVSFHLYRNLAQDNRDEIVGIMNFYKTFYRWIAALIWVVGLAVVPFLRYIIKDSKFSLEYITLIYVIYLFKTAVSYLFSYNFTIATADQKSYILTKIDIAVHVVMSIVNIFSLILFHNYVVYLVGEIMLVFVGNIIKTRRVYKEYPYIRNADKIKTETKKKLLADVKNIFAGKISTVLLTSTDNILISAMVGIRTVGLYSNYSMIIAYIQAFLTQITSATQASLGNMLATESKEYSYSILKRLTTILYFVLSFCTVCLFNLLNPFIAVWIGEDYLLNVSAVALTVFSFYIQIIRTPLWHSVGGVGYFKDDRNIAIYGALSNLVVSILSAKYLGLVGIFIGTIFSQVTQILLKAHLFMRKYLGKSTKEYLRLLGGLTLLTISMSGGLYLILERFNIVSPIVDLIVRTCFCLIVPNLVNLLLFRKTNAFCYTVSLAKQFVRREAK